MDIVNISALMEALSRPGLSSDEYTRLVGKMRLGARDILTSLVSSHSNEHVQIACKLIATLNHEYAPLLDVQTVLPDIITILMDSRLVRSKESLEAHSSVVSLLEVLLIAQFLPKHLHTINAFITDMTRLVNDLQDATERQETRILAGSILSKASALQTVSAFSSFYQCDFEVVSHTSRQALANLDISHTSKNNALSIGLLSLIASLFGHFKDISPSLVDDLWSLSTRMMKRLTIHLLDDILPTDPAATPAKPPHTTPHTTSNQPSKAQLYAGFLPKVFLFEKVIHLLNALFLTSYIPSSPIVTSFVSQLLQTSTMALFMPTNQATRTLWSTFVNSLISLLSRLSSSSPFVSAAAFPASFFPSIAFKCETCSSYPLARAIFAFYESRLSRSFLPPFTLAAITSALPSLLHIPELLPSVRIFTKALIDRHSKTTNFHLKPDPSHHLTATLTTASLSSTTPLAAQSLSSVVTTQYKNGPFATSSNTSSLLHQPSFSTSPPAKRTKLQEVSGGGPLQRAIAQHDHFSQMPPSLFDMPPLDLFTEVCIKLFEEAAVARSSKSNWNNVFQLESKAVHASIALLKVQIDNLPIRSKHSGSFSASSKRSQGKKSSSSTLAASSSALTPLFHVKVGQRADTEMLTLGIFVTVRRVADFLLEHLSPPKSAPLALFVQGSTLLDTLIDLMTVLPPGDTQLPSATAGLLSHLCELPFANVSSSQSIYRPSMIPMPSEQQKSVVHANIQTSTAPEVLKFIDSALMLHAAFLYRSGEPHIFNAAINDVRQEVVLSSLVHFPVLMVKLPETVLQGDIVSSFFHTALTILKAQFPLPTTQRGTSGSEERRTIVYSVTRFFQNVACALHPSTFVDSDLDISTHAHQEPVDQDMKVAIVHNASQTHPDFSVVCLGRCCKHLHSPTFLTTSSARLRALSSVRLEWDLVAKLLIECYSTSPFLDSSVRLMLLNAQRSVFLHYTLAQYRAGRLQSPQSSATQFSPITRPHPQLARSPPKIASANAMDIDTTGSAANAQTTKPELPKQILDEITASFRLAIHGETHAIRTSAADGLVAMTEDHILEKGASAINNAILEEMQSVASGLNRSSSQPLGNATDESRGSLSGHIIGLGMDRSGEGNHFGNSPLTALDIDGMGAEETLLNLVGRIGGKMEGWYVLPPLLVLLTYLTDIRISVKACAFTSIRRMSSEHGMEAKEVVKKCEPKIGIHLLKSLRSKAPLVDEVCLSILDTDPVSYLTSCFPYLLPKIVLKRDGELLDLLAEKTKKDPAEILINHMAPILVATVCKPNPPFDIVQFIVDRTKVSAVELFTKFHRAILLGVVLLLGDKSRKKFVGFALTFIMTTLSMARVGSTSSSHLPSTSTAAASSASSSSHNNQLSTDNRSANAKKSSATSNVIVLDDSDSPANDPLNSSLLQLSQSSATGGSNSLIPPGGRYTSRADLLADRFLLLSNYLVYDHILRNGASIEEKKKALRAYKGLVKLLGPHIDKFYVIIGSVLRLTMTECTDAAMRSETCKAWFSFLRHLPDRCLGPILGPTTVFLLSYEAYESDIVPILEFLFITKESVLKPFFRDVPLLPDRPSLSRVHSKWKDAQPSTANSASISHKKGSRAENALSSFSSSDLRVQLSQIMSLAKNDDCSIREMALKQLINFLRGHRMELARIVSTEHGMDPVIVELMELLLKGSRDQVNVVRLKYARAMGEMGAIDPYRLSPLLSSQIVVPHLDHTEEEFAIELIEKYLVKTYRTARLVKSQDAACFTIQEILKFFECDASTPTKTQSYMAANPSGTNASSNPQGHSSSHSKSGSTTKSSKLRKDISLWSKLTSETKSLVHPFLASEYRLNLSYNWISSSQQGSQGPGSENAMEVSMSNTGTAAHTSMDMSALGRHEDSGTYGRRHMRGEAPAGMHSSSPISAYQPGMSYGIWLELWLERLIVDSKSGLFRACEAIIANDLETSHFILPHLVLSILHNGSPAAHESILHEMLVVLGAKSWDASVASNVPRTISNVSHLNLENVNPMAAQRIFNLVDCLSQWVEGKYKEYREMKVQWNEQKRGEGELGILAPKVDPRVTAVELLLSKIPQLAVSKTALSISAFSRSLMHFEKSCRVPTGTEERNPGGLPALKPITDPAEMALLQQIYANLDDPDALEALMHVKGQGKNVWDLSDSYRASGRWNENLIVLDKLMRQKQTDPETLSHLQAGRLECLAELGLFDQLLSLAYSCLSDPLQTSHSKHIQKVRSYGAQAAWKLGDWKAIETLISNHSQAMNSTNPLQLYSGGNFDLGIGQIFLALRNRKKSQFENTLQAIRSDLLQPLATASLESYDRTYPIIVKLQMLNELEDSWTLLFGSEGDKPDSTSSETSMPALPFGRDAANPNNVSITNPELLDKSIAGLLQMDQSVDSSKILAAADPSSQRSRGQANNLITISMSDKAMRDRLIILGEWRQRLSMMQYSYKVREPILSLRLAVFGVAEMEKDATEAWISLAKMSRKTHKFTMAQYAMLRVRDSSELASQLEGAKLLWASHERSKALIEVDKLVEASKVSILSSNALQTTPSSADARHSADNARMRIQGAQSAQRANLLSSAAATSSSATSSGRSMSGAKSDGRPDGRGEGGAPSRTSSRPALSRSSSNSVGNGGVYIVSDEEVYKKAKLLKARWMLESQYGVQAIHEAFGEAMGLDDKSSPPKGQYYNGLFSDHLCTEYKRKLYSLPSKPVAPSTNSSAGVPSMRRSSSSSKSGSASAMAGLPPMLTPQALQYWTSMRAAFSAFAFSLVRTSKFSFQTLPRLVSMWFEIAEALQDLFVRYPASATINANPSQSEPFNIKVPAREQIPAGDKTAKQVLETYQTAMSMVSMLFKVLPGYVWLISYSLLISGCVQRNKDVEDLIGRIILKVLQTHPQHAIWHIFPLKYSNCEERKQKYDWIRKQTVSHSYKGETSLYQFFDEAAALAHEISVLCAHKLGKDKGNSTMELKLSDMCAIERRIPRELIMPSEQQLSCVHLIDSMKDPHNPFAYQAVYIKRANSKVQVLKSLARPRKLILYGSDDAEYWFLCKPVDDLRKDARMMEFSGMVNRLLKKDLETRRRDLKIRTYAVLPLSDNSGILSWVPNTNGLRGIIGDMYAMDGLDLTEKIKEIRKPFEMAQAKEPTKFETMFVEKILPKFPLALSKWFLQNFAEPSQWLKARTNFARTCGVMSVIGTILGLGDRHCENILVDSKNGDCLHVDLNCIFHKGRSFAIPEVVPFRLTRNMVDAFGITGIEGAFRKSCELTMAIMRQNKDSLISVLGTFVHDPLLEWSSQDAVPSSAATMTRTKLAAAANEQQQQANERNKTDPQVPPGYSHERHNKLAVEIINGISDRLDGLMRTPDNLDQLIVPLSVQGYVDEVIKESTSNTNLCKMYIGWSPFL